MTRAYTQHGSATPSGEGEPARRSRTSGLIALALALVAGVVAPALVAIAAYEIGSGAVDERLLMTVSVDWSVLTPVREWVLVGEVSFWVGTVCGLWAVAQGIVATVRRTGRGPGLAALIVGAVAPLIFVVALQVGLVLGVGYAFVSM